MPAHFEEDPDDGEAIWLRHRGRKKAILRVPVYEVQLQNKTYSNYTYYVRMIPEISMLVVMKLSFHKTGTNLCVVQPPIDGVLRPLCPRGAAPVRVELDQSESVIP